MGQKTSYPIIPGIWFSTRANLIGTWGLRRHAVDVAPDGMGWDGNGATEERVGSGQVRTRCHLYVWKKRRSMDHPRN